MRNRFMIWRRGAAAPAEFDPAELRRSATPSDARYFSGILEAVNQKLPDRGLTFLLTWNLDAFDERLRDAIVLLIGDEMYQTPSYATAVRAIFKTGGVRRNSLSSMLALPYPIGWRIGVREMRNVAVGLRRRSKARWGAGQRAPMFEIPLGYSHLVDVPFVPFGERPIDVFFAGALPSNAGSFSIRPAVTARRQMAAALEEVRAACPELRIEHKLATHAELHGPEAYSRLLMSAKIALCPRGNIDETFRLLEAAKCGSVAIAEPLPRRWYNVNSPAVQITGWRHLLPTLRNVMADTGQLATRAEQMHHWWNTCISETAVAEYVCTRLP